MTKRLAVLAAVKTMLEAALPGMTVLGLDPGDIKPDDLPSGGLAWIDYGDPGPPTVDLSPPTYHYEHDIPVDLSFYQASDAAPAIFLDPKLAAIDAAVRADRTVGGLCDYLEPTAPTGGYVDRTGARPIAWVSFILTASYSTPSPLG